MAYHSITWRTAMHPGQCPACFSFPLWADFAPWHFLQASFVSPRLTGQGGQVGDFLGSWFCGKRCVRLWDCRRREATLKKKIIYLTVLGLSCSRQDLLWTLSCGMWDLVPWRGIEPGPPGLECESLATGPPGKSREATFLIAMNMFAGCIFVHLSWQGSSFLFPLPASKETQETAGLSGSPSRWVSDRAPFKSLCGELPGSVATCIRISGALTLWECS